MFLLVVPPIYNHCPSQKANWEITGNRSPPTGLELNLATEKQITFHFADEAEFTACWAADGAAPSLPPRPYRRRIPSDKSFSVSFSQRAPVSKDVETSFIAVKMCFFIDIDP